ncbi:sterol desaturase family protein [Sphingomonas colocasiae]|uniref:Sterol desaturase family protein n=1 Tax=Sphingomonas colocasiae TaxID=1848973 RepID=A0ABS7PP20_9SPHN|nr:sterol desaturase family protein [Sphingomonas colocasiae]MBY8823059.1 sterol desaturase family protein [Sphingomonas colocasiae]
MSAPVFSQQRVRLFKSERLEKLTLISPRAFALGWSLMLPTILWAGSNTADPLDAPFKCLGLVGSGLLIWTLFEYAMHRYLFHLTVDLSPVRWFVFLIHGNHHDNPNDPMRDMMPLAVSIPVSALIWGLCILLLGAPGTWLFLGFITGYVIYDAIHYACHQWPMRGRLGAALKRHHMRHHHVDDHGNYAISAIFWDYIFGSKIKSFKR